MVEVEITMAMDGTGDKHFSWTEGHALLVTPDSLKDNDKDYRDLANKRIACCGANAYLVTVRASRPEVRRDVYVLYGSDSDSGLVQYGGFQGDGNHCMHANLSFQVRHQASDPQWGFFYMAGFPAVLHSTEPPGPIYTNLPGYEKKLNQYFSFLKNGQWGAFYLDNPPLSGPFNIQEWTNEAAGQLRLIATLDNADAVFGVGDKVHVRNVKMVQKGLKRPVGEWKIVDMTAGATQTTYVLRNSTGYDATQIEEPGTMESISGSYRSYKDITMAGITSHKRGGAATRAHGRSSARPTH